MSQDLPAMTSYRPYLLRALAEWIADNDMTPHLLVDASGAGVQVPASAVKDGKVVLNIAQRAVSRLQIDNDGVSFSARFGGVSFPVMVPMASVLAIYSRETGQGMALPEDAHHASDAGVPEHQHGADDGDTPPEDTPPPAKRPHLRVVK